MKNDFKFFILWGATLFPVLITINTILFNIFLAPHESFFFNLAAAIVVSWLLMLVLYYVWALYFYNINRGWTDKDWNDHDKRLFIQGTDPSPEKNPNTEETLGLPAGTVRGTIALSIIVGGLAMMIASFSLPTKLGHSEFFIDNFEFFKTAFIMTIAFYFGSKSLEFLKDRKQVIGGESSTQNKEEPTKDLPPSPLPSLNVNATEARTLLQEGSVPKIQSTEFNDPNAKG